MLRRNIGGRRRRRNLAGATNGQLCFNTTVAGWTVTSPPHSYFFLWNPQSGTTSVSEDRTAKYRDGPITQGSPIEVAVLLRQPDNELRNSLTFSFVAADFKDFCRGRERVAHC